MKQKFVKYLDNVYEKYPNLKKVPPTDSSKYEKMSLDELMKKGFMNFKASKKQLLRLSILIEKYAEKNQSPLLATFEDEAKFKYAEDRYVELIKKIPMTWIVANFHNPFLAQDFPKNAETISCNGTNLETVWAVITKGPAGPMGLVTEELADGSFEGFFSISPYIVQKAIDEINASLKVDIDVNQKF